MAEQKKKIVIAFGTRPEAIKMAPLARALKLDPQFETRVLVTGQHRQMLDPILALFGIVPDVDLNVMQPNQSLAALTANILIKADDFFRSEKGIVRVLVHGDTTTSMAVSLAAFYNKIPVGHVEAGLRTNNIYSPWPEEANRQINGVIADLHFAPTEGAKLNLLSEGVASDSIKVTGNTVIDALLYARDKTGHDFKLEEAYQFLDKTKKLILITGHRRENFGEGFINICEAIRDIAARPEVEIVYPVHLNPNVQKPVYELLGNLPNVHLVAPVDYRAFVYLMERSYIILTDSGGVQEEAPALGKPVLVMRETTERPEAVEAGTVMLVGSRKAEIVSSVDLLLEQQAIYNKMSRAHNPYGDGQAVRRIIASL